MLPPPTHHAALRALGTVALVDGELDPREARFLDKVTGGLFGEIDATPIAPEEVADAITDPDERLALVQHMALLVGYDEAVRPEEIASCRAFARALAVEEPALRQLELFASGSHARMGFDLFTKGFVGEMIQKKKEGLGVFSRLSMMGAMMGLPQPSERDRFEALGALPEGTLGRGLHRQIHDNGFPVPGSFGGTPALLLFHDLGHVLTGFATDVPGEVRVGGFEAGYMGRAGFSVAMLALFLFQLGAKIPRTQPAVGAFDLEAFYAAHALGEAMKADLRFWDPWPHMERPVAELRLELGLPAEGAGF